MKRATILYGGQEFVVARSEQDVRAEVDALTQGGATGWLQVNHGRGMLQVAHLHVSPHIPIAVVDTSDPD